MTKAKQEISSSNYYVYIVRCADNSLYCGQTNDLGKRVREHNTSKSRSAKYTKIRRPVKLVYYEKYSTIGEALRRECQIKKWPKKKKEQLISGEIVT